MSVLVKCVKEMPQLFTKILDLSKLKAFADNKINVTQKLKCVSAREDNIVAEGEHAGHQHFLLFPQCFPKALSQGR